MFNNNNDDDDNIKTLTHPTSLMLLVGEIDVRQSTLTTLTTFPPQTNSTQPTRVAGVIGGIATIITNHSTIVSHTTSAFPILVYAVILILILLLLLLPLQRTTPTHSSHIGMVVGASNVVTTWLITINTTPIYILVGVHCHNKPPPPSASLLSCQWKLSNAYQALDNDYPPSPSPSPSLSLLTLTLGL